MTLLLTFKILDDVIISNFVRLLISNDVILDLSNWRWRHDDLLFETFAFMTSYSAFSSEIINNFYAWWRHYFNSLISDDVISISFQPFWRDQSGKNLEAETTLRLLLNKRWFIAREFGGIDNRSGELWTAPHSKEKLAAKRDCDWSKWKMKLRGLSSK